MWLKPADLWPWPAAVRPTQRWITSRGTAWLWTGALYNVSIVKMWFRPRLTLQNGQYLTLQPVVSECFWTACWFVSSNTLWNTKWIFSPFAQRGAPSLAPSSPSQRSAQERAVSTTVRPGIESEPTALLSSLSESEVRNDSCTDTLSFTLCVLPLANLWTLLLEDLCYSPSVAAVPVFCLCCYVKTFITLSIKSSGHEKSIHEVVIC